MTREYNGFNCDAQHIIMLSVVILSVRLKRNDLNLSLCRETDSQDASE
jgi:hypothetical protein